jgi:hypothetical protein
MTPKRNPWGYSRSPAMYKQALRGRAVDAGALAAHVVKLAAEADPRGAVSLMSEGSAP